MGNADQELEKVRVTLEKYRKNKTMVAPEDLAGKYRAAFERLKEQLKEELSDYLRAYCLKGLLVKPCDSEETKNVLNQAYKDAGVGKAVGRAAFQRFDLEEVRRIAEEHRRRVYDIWLPYFHKHTCAYVYAKCFAEEDPDDPLIYNTLIDRFWDKATGSWVEREKPEGIAIMFFPRESEG